MPEQPHPTHSNLAEIEKLRAAVKESARIAHEAMDSERRWCAEVEALRAKCDRYRQALEQIQHWASEEPSTAVSRMCRIVAEEALDD